MASVKFYEISLLFFLAGLFLLVLSPHVEADKQYNIPDWVKGNMKGWVSGQLHDSDFIQGIQGLISSNIIQGNVPQLSNNNQYVPSWIKKPTEWWLDGQISDNDFISGLQYMVQVGIVINLAESKQVILFTPNPTSDLLSMLYKHIDSNDMISSFNTRVINTYSNVQRILLGHSMDRIQQAIQTAQSNPNPITYIGYDNEAANGNLSTPPEEIQDPGSYTNMAADVVHQAGYKFAVAPTKALLIQEYKQVDWTKVDLLIMQLQRFTKDEISFTSTVSQIASYARAENPHLLIFVQVNPAFDDSLHLATLLSKVSGYINGTSIVVVNTQPTTVENLLTAIGR